jgi:hypothetical protein
MTGFKLSFPKQRKQDEQQYEVKSYQFGVFLTQYSVQKRADINKSIPEAPIIQFFVPVIQNRR